MKQFTNLAEFKGQLKEGNKIEIISHTILTNGSTDDIRFTGVVLEVFDNGFSYQYNNGSADIKTTQWDQTEITWSGSHALMKSDGSYCSVYHSELFGYSSTILFKGSTGCNTFAIHPDKPSCCPKCKGSGMNYTTISEWDKKEKQISISSCYDCKGLPVDEKEGKQIQVNIDAEAAMWCSCDNGHDSYYVDNTKRMKHHWRCKKCRKITQIG
jgi:hypothetical protein